MLSLKKKKISLKVAEDTLSEDMVVNVIVNTATEQVNFKKVLKNFFRHEKINLSKSHDITFCKIKSKERNQQN